MGKFPPPTGLLMGNFLTHRVKRVWVRSHLPHTRYPVVPRLKYITATNPNPTSLIHRRRPSFSQSPDLSSPVAPSQIQIEKSISPTPVVMSHES
jgi:hypothetical protein